LTSPRLLLILFFFQALTAFAACKATPGADLIWRSKTLQYVFIGELHGSNETPAAFGQLVCDALMHGRRVVVALERPTSEQVSLTSIVSSPDESAATRVLLEQPDWQQGMDGRASQAMLSLLLYLRQLHASYSALQVTAFEAPFSNDPAGARDQAMGTKLLSIGKENPESLILILTGNTHGMEAPMFRYNFAAMYVAPQNRLSLQVTDKGGSSWATVRGACGPQKGTTGDKGANKPFGIYLDPSLAPFGKVDGVLSLDIPLTSSPPAAGDPNPLPACRAKYMAQQ
jgi:hypothetical protein